LDILLTKDGFPNQQHPPKYSPKNQSIVTCSRSIFRWRGDYGGVPSSYAFRSRGGLEELKCVDDGGDGEEDSEEHCDVNWGEKEDVKENIRLVPSSKQGILESHPTRINSNIVKCQANHQHDEDEEGGDTIVVGHVPI